MRKNKVFLLSLSILALLVIGSVIGRFILDQKLEDFLQHELEKQLGEDYEIEFKQSDLELLGNALHIDSLTFIKKGDSINEVHLKVESLDFYGFKPLTFLFKNRFGVDSISLVKPLIALRTFSFDSDSSSNTHNANSEDKNQRGFEIGTIRSYDGKFKYDPAGPEKLTCAFDFSINNIAYQNELVEIKTLWEKSELFVADVQYMFPDSIQAVEVKHLLLQKNNSDIKCKNVHYYSTLDKLEYPKHYGWRKARFDLHIAQIDVSRPVNVTDSLLILPKIELDSVDLKIHKDARYPWPDRVTVLPQSHLTSIQKSLRIDTVQFDNSEFVFEGIFGDNAPAKFDFTAVSGSLTGLQNIDKTAPAFIFRAKASFMNKSPLSAVIQYDYGPEDPFTCSAVLGRTHLDFMSDFLQKMAGVRIESGVANKLELSMSGNKHSGQGYVDFYYTDLKLIAVDKQTGEKAWFMNLLADVAGGLIFWKQNPEGENFRRGTFSKERVTYKGFAAQWIDGLFEGLLSSVSKIDPSKVKRTKKKKSN